MVSKPNRPRGRPAQYIDDRDGDPIVGLSRMPETATKKRKGKPDLQVADGRYYATGSKPRAYFGTDFDLAVMRFRAWQARERGQTVEVEYDVPLDPNSKQKINLLRRAYRKPPVGDSLPVTNSLPEDVFWAKVREFLSSDKGRRTAAQRTGIKEIEWLFDLEPPPKPTTLDEIGKFYVNKKPPIGADERKPSRQIWRQFCEIVGVSTIDKLTQEHVHEYRDQIYRLHGDNKHVNSYVTRRFSKIGTIFRWFDRMNINPDQSRRILALLTVLVPPKKGKSLPTPIKKSDLNRLLKVATTEETALVLLGVNCAFYPGDCRILTKENGLDLERGVYAGYRHKTDIPQCSVLWARTIKAVKKHLAENPNPTDYIFAKKTVTKHKTKYIQYGAETFRRLFFDLRERAKVNPRVKFDNLRDGAASNAGTDQQQINILLGHRAAGLTDAYVLRNPKMVEPACKAIEAHYFPPKKRSKR